MSDGPHPHCAVEVPDEITRSITHAITKKLGLVTILVIQPHRRRGEQKTTKKKKKPYRLNLIASSTVCCKAWMDSSGFTTSITGSV